MLHPQLSSLLSFIGVDTTSPIIGSFCNVCRIDFKYPSKLIRHIQTTTHQAFVANLQSREFDQHETEGIPVTEYNQDDMVRVGECVCVCM